MPLGAAAAAKAGAKQAGRKASNNKSKSKSKTRMGKSSSVLSSLKIGSLREAIEQVKSNKKGLKRGGK